MVYDQARGEHVVFGGYRSEVVPRLGDTWIFDGQTWTQHNVTGPSPRSEAGFAYDPLRQECVLFGGRGRAMRPVRVIDG